MSASGTITLISTDKAPAAIGPYSQAVRHGSTVYCSGCIALDRTAGTLVGTTAADQAEVALQNMAAVLEASGSSMQLVLKTTVLLRDMADFAKVNEVYSKHFGTHCPARSTFAVAGLPRNALIEIECIAAVAPHVVQ